MAPHSHASDSANSSTSAASHITVTPSKQAANALLLASDSVSPSPSPAKSATSTPNRGRAVAASTPTTSLPESTESAACSQDKRESTATAVGIMDGEGRRSRRARPSVATYDLKKLSAAQLEEREVEASRRNVSGLTGRTLVDDEEEQTQAPEAIRKAEAMDWEATAEEDLAAMGAPSSKLSRKPSVKDRVKKAANKVGSVLGKRGREVVEAGKSKLGMKEESKADPRSERLLKQLDTGPKGYLDELDLDSIVEEKEMARPAKKAKTNGKEPLKEISQPPVPASLKRTASGKPGKKWLSHGLFMGQEADVDFTAKGREKKGQKGRPGSSASADANDAQVGKARFPPLPMFNYLEKTRDFLVPFDVFAPSFKRGDDKPKDWTRLNRNRLVGEAKDLWEKEEKLPQSMCICRKPKEGEKGCDVNCWNRDMEYECNERNCALLPFQCSNRAFSELTARTKKGGAYDVGVEVVKTNNRGFGVRSCRTFEPGQIIMEYTGEIVSEEECERRMHEEYAGKANYYLMALQRGLIIDGTKGSMARFINHSCAPNCTVKMVKVNGTPRMGVFAGEEGIMTGEELSYDYNFDNFGENRQVCYCGAPNCRGFLSKRLNAAEKKAAEKEERERLKREAEEEERKRVEEERKKAVKTDRGSGWRGWVPVAEVKEMLVEEKRKKEEQEKNSTRARRLAARRGEAVADEPTPAPEPRGTKRKSVEITNDTTTNTSAGAAESSKPAVNDTSEEKKRPKKLAKKNPRPSNTKRTTSVTTTKTTVTFPNLTSNDIPISHDESTNSTAEEAEQATVPPAACHSSPSQAPPPATHVGADANPTASAGAEAGEDEDDGVQHQQLLHEDRPCSKHSHHYRKDSTKSAESEAKSAHKGKASEGGFFAGLGESVKSAFAKKGGLGGSGAETGKQQREAKGKAKGELRQSTLSFGKRG
ncbi:hypothetical protein MBLNU230_g3066t1 [Neophaeotheca triangularis]